MNTIEVLTDNKKVHWLLHLADTNLILSHRNSEWCGHGPVLEQDIALTNISLDQLGQARLFYQHAADILNQTNKNSDHTEDSLAYLRTEREFTNLLMCELPKGDWAFTTLRQYLFSVFFRMYYTGLLQHTDSEIAAIAEKSLKEVNYHVRWSREWVLRLGDGTPESNARMRNALLEIWPYTGEMFVAGKFDDNTITGVDIATLKQAWEAEVMQTLSEATLPLPEPDVFMQQGGKEGIHTEHLGYILAEMQYLQRTYPNATW